MEEEHTQMPAEGETDEVTPEAQERGLDPLTRTLRLFAGGLLIVVLAAALAFTLYLQNLDAPRTAAERNLATWRTAVEEQPDVLENHVKLAYAYALAGRYDEAIEAIDIAGQMTDAPELEVLIARGDILRVSEQYDAAIEVYDEAITLAESVYADRVEDAKGKGVAYTAPNTPLATALRGRGIARKESGDLGTAVADLEAALEITPTDAATWVLLGEYRAEDGDRDRAIEAYNEALRFVPDYPEALVGLRELGETR